MSSFNHMLASKKKDSGKRKQNHESGLQRGNKIQKPIRLKDYSENPSPSPFATSTPETPTVPTIFSLRDYRNEDSSFPTGKLSLKNHLPKNCILSSIKN